MSTNTDGSIKSYDTSSTEHEIDEVVESFVSAADVPDTVSKKFSELVKGLDQRVQEAERSAAVANERAREAEEKVEEQAIEIEKLESQLDEEKDRRSAEIEGVHNRINNVKKGIDNTDPCTQADRTTIQDEDLTPIEQLSQADDIEKVTDSQSVQRAVSIFKNINNWGHRTPKGIVLKSSDNPLSLLEADQDEDLAWKQYYRSAEALEQLSEGSVTFFHSDKHGKMICLHEQSEAYQRVVEGRLTPSSVKAEG